MPAIKNQRDPIQIELLLPELGFPGRDTVRASEIAQKLTCTKEHIYNAIDSGQLEAIDIGIKERSNPRVSVTCYYAYLVKKLTSIPQENPVLNLETQKLILLMRQIADRLETRGEHPVKILTSKK